MSAAQAVHPETALPRRIGRRGRLDLARRIALFHAKLFADGLRDLAMSPLSLAAGVAGMLSPRDHEAPFERLMQLGRSSDRWINLYEFQHPDDPGEATLDRLADELEAAVRRDFERGGLSAQGAERLRGLAQRLRRG